MRLLQTVYMDMKTKAETITDQARLTVFAFFPRTFLGGVGFGSF